MEATIQQTKPRITAFEEICILVKNVDTNGDSIMQTMKMRNINEKLKIHVRDEKQLSELYDMLNSRALEDEEFILSLVAVITSMQCASFAVNGKTLRHGMMSLLQKNYQNADNLKKEDLQKLYNSFRLLGEYYNKARLQNGSPISVVGQSLLNCLNVELEKELRNICHFKNDGQNGENFARLLLSQITLNGRLFKNRQKTDIEQVLFTIRKCLIEIPSLTAKTKAFLLMTLDLFYNNFANVGNALERMYQGFLIENKPVTTAENGVVAERTPNGRQEKEKLQKSLERMAVSKMPEESKTKPHNLKLNIRKSDSIKSVPLSPYKNFPASPSINSPNSPSRIFLASPSRNAQIYNTTPRRDVSAPPARSGPNSRQKNAPQKSPQKTMQQSQPSRSPQSRSVSASPQFRSYSASPRKKLSPQELRAKKSHQFTSGPREVKQADSAINNQPDQSETTPAELTNGNDENILRPQNSRSSTPSSSTQTPKHKSNSKVYFREENVENLTWNGEPIDGDCEDPDASTSPKVNPYSSSFLNFLSSN